MRHLESFFPRLRASGARITSRKTLVYNCIAWAAGDEDNWWWPDRYWPPGAPRAETVDAFVAAYQTLGYQPCADALHEPEFEKVAIYATSEGTPRHAARQCPNGRWTSKLGAFEDIEHGPDGVNGPLYGEPVRYLRRQRGRRNAAGIP